MRNLLQAGLVRCVEPPGADPLARWCGGCDQKWRRRADLSVHRDAYSQPRSFTKLAFGVTSSASTPSCLTISSRRIIHISFGPIGLCSFLSFVAFNARTRPYNPRKVPKSVANFVANGVVTKDVRKPMIIRHVMRKTGT